MFGWNSRDARIAELEAAVAERDAVIAGLARELSAALGTVRNLEQQMGAALDRIRKLEAQLRQNSTNSSKPPSSDPPTVKRRSKVRTGRKPGGQPGHPRHQRMLLPPERVTHVVEVVPPACECCGGAVDLRDDEDPLRDQVVDLPKLCALVTEYRRRRGWCGPCEHWTMAELPPEARNVFGSGLVAVMSWLAGKYHLSKRQVQELLADLLGVEVALGTVSNLEQQMSAALAPPVEQAREYVRVQPAVNADESGWYEGQADGHKPRAWLWVAVGGLVTVFLIARSRGQHVARSMLGEKFAGLLGTDRYGAYRWVDAARRQLCWAHLLRDLQGFVDRGGKGAEFGAALLARAIQMFAGWDRLKAGALSREEFVTWMEPIEQDILRSLHLAAQHAERKTAGMAREILKLRAALFTFVRTPGIEPTNNISERQLRPGVLWRRTSFGTQSEAGSRFVERMLTVVLTLRMQKRGVLDYLTEAHRAWVLGTTPPSLLPPTAPIG